MSDIPFCISRFPPRQPDTRPVPPVLKKYLPMYQGPDFVEELKAHDRAKLRRQRNGRERRSDYGHMTQDSLESLDTRDQGSSNRKILLRPSIIVSCCKFYFSPIFVEMAAFVACNTSAKLLISNQSRVHMRRLYDYSL